MKSLRLLSFSRRGSFKLQKEWLDQAYSGLNVILVPITDDIVESLYFKTIYIHACSPSIESDKNYIKALPPDTAYRIINSCRYLSQLPFLKALSIINQTYYRLSKIFHIHNPSAFFSQPPDLYTVFLCELICSELQIPFLTAFASRFCTGSSVLFHSKSLTSPQYRSNLLISNNISCKFSNNEISQYINKLHSNDYDPWNEKTSSRLRGALSILTKCTKGELSILFNLIVGITVALRFPKDSYPLPWQLAGICYPSTSRLIKYIRIPKHDTKSLSRIPEYQASLSKSKVLYFPLQFFPESSNQFLVDDGYSAIWQLYPLICQMLVSAGYFLVIKEHPFCIGMRDIHFYKSLPSSNIAFLHHSVSKTDVFSSVNCSLLIGSLIFEALSLEAPFVSLGQSLLLPDYKYNSKSTSDLLYNIDLAISDSREESIGQLAISKTYKQMILDNLLRRYLSSHVSMPTPVSSPAIRSIKNLLVTIAR